MQKDLHATACKVCTSARLDICGFLWIGLKEETQVRVSTTGEESAHAAVD